MGKQTLVAPALGLTRPNFFHVAVDMVSEGAAVEAARTGEAFEVVYERKWNGVMAELSHAYPGSLALIEADAAATFPSRPPA